jgi:hypothetical protein
MNTNPISSNTTASSSVTTGSTTTTTTPRMRSDTYPSGEPNGYQASRSGASESDLESRRRQHLLDAVGGYADVDEGENVDEVLDGREECPRYLLRSHNDDGEWHRFELDDDLGDIRSLASNNILDNRAWWPCAVIDLDSGEGLDIDIDVTVRVAAPTEESER